MIQTEMTDELERAEGLMLQGQPERAAELLTRLAEDAEEYVDKNCPTTDEVQWFSFPTLFERLAYRRVEKDPRELRDVGEPLDRLAVGRVLRRLRKSGEPANRNRGRSQQRRENRPRNARRLALLRLPCRLRRSHSAQKVAPAFLAFRLPCENGKESPQAPFPSCRQPPQLPGAPAAPRYRTRRRAATRATAPPATPMAPSAHAVPFGSPVVASFLRLWSSFSPSGSGSGPGSGAT